MFSIKSQYVISGYVFSSILKPLGVASPRYNKGKTNSLKVVKFLNSGFK